MRRRIVMAIFCAAAALQLGFCAFLVIRSELTLRSALTISLRIGGYDPRDLFRGRYLAFSLEDIDQGSVEDWYLPAFGKKELPPNHAFFVSLGVEEGKDYAVIQDISLKGEGPGKAWLRLETDDEGWLKPPLDRFYLPEDGAQEIDRAFAAAKDRRLEISLRNGSAQIKTLILDGQRIESEGK